MSKINPLNIAKLLLDDISSFYTESTPINSKEMELKDQLLGEYFQLMIYPHRR
jgi:hypothetical protein